MQDLIKFKNFLIKTYSPFISFILSIFFHLLAVYTIYFWSLPDYSKPIICGLEQKKEQYDENMLSFTFDSNQLKGEQKETNSTEQGEQNSDIYNKLSEAQKKKWDKLLNNLEKTKNLRKNFLEDFTNLMNSDAPQSYIKRKRDYEDIIVKETIPTLKNIEKSFEEIISEAPKELEEHKERNKIIEQFRKNESSDYNSVSISNVESNTNFSKPVLKLSKNERQKYLDDSITLEKEQIFENFQNKFMSYDPNKGDLPIFVRELYYENLQRLAYFFSSDDTYFSIDYLQEALNKEDFLKNAMSYLSELQGTKTATELLYIIENIYEIQKRTVQIYFENKAKIKNLPPEYDNQIRVETLKRNVSKYDKIMSKKQIKNFEDASQLYEKKRIEILDYLIKTTPKNYRVADALFLKGNIYWERYEKNKNVELKKKAVVNWQKINKLENIKEGDFLNKKTFEKIKPFLEFLITDLSDIEYQVSMILNENLATKTEEKRVREEKLLWN